MVRHGFDVIRRTTKFLNPQQIPVMEVDQPLFAIAKQNQWLFPDEYGEDFFVVLLDGLHLEKAALKMIGHLLKGTGWVEVISIVANVFTSGRAESFLDCTHITRTRYSHQVTAAALKILLLRAFKNAQSSSTIKEWSQNREQQSQQFKFWTLILQLQLTVLCLIRGFRERNLNLYIESMKTVVPWFFALNHSHYQRWLPVHIKDMLELKDRHPSIYKEFANGCFTGQKSHKRFSFIALDQIHEQENIKVKHAGGAIDILDKENALRRWMLAGPELSNILEDFEGQVEKRFCDLRDLHHDEGVMDF